jgi:high-affinity Fe2+/Pb2+ permease
MIFGAVFGWTNSATLGSVLAYVGYWLLVIGLLAWMKFREVSEAALVGLRAVLTKMCPGADGVPEAVEAVGEELASAMRRKMYNTQK